MAIPSETVALPLVKGLDLQTDARLLQAPSLLEAENTQFSGGGAKKRRGHTSLTVRTDSGVLGDSTTWTYGAGLGDTARGGSEVDTQYWTYENANVGRLFGLFTRDDETVLWDGFRLLSYAPSQEENQAPSFATISPATLPTLRSSPLGKANEAQEEPEFADNGTVKCVAWISSGAAKYVVYDSVTGARMASGTLGLVTGEYLRVFSVGSWMHIAVKDSGNSRVCLFSFASSDPQTITFRSLGDCRHFDLAKHSDSAALLVRTDYDGVHGHWIGETGSGATGFTHFFYTPTVVSDWQQVTCTTFSGGSFVSCYNGTDTIACAVVDTNGDLKAETLFSATVTRLTTSAHKVNAVDAPPFSIYWDDGNNIYFRRAKYIAPGSLTSSASTSTRYNLTLASRAFRVGDRVFLFAGHNSEVQSSWFLLDEGLLPVGKAEFGVADVTNSALRGVNFSAGEDPDSDTPRYQCALLTRTRVTPPGVTPGTIYSEAFPKAVYLDFLPRLRAAQAGRTTYISGAQVWAYDGEELVEANFHLGPEPTYLAATGGTLDTAGQYSYRVDLCHRNAQGEEVRSLSILSDTIDLASTNSKITLTIPTVLTRREDSYFLIYRNAMSSGTPLVNWWLLNSRDPASADYLANDLSVANVTYIDSGAVSDTDIQTRELHPASDTYIQPISAPACEIIAAGRDRLWVAGGELPPGRLAPSRLFEAGEVPSFSPYLELFVDRGNEAVTAIGFTGEVALIFRRNSTYVLDSDGPDNNAAGTWNYPRLALADTGAVSQDSVVRTSRGLLFQSPAGFRQVGPGGALEPTGLDIDSAAKDFTVVGAIVSERDQEARFYGEDGTYVFNYLYGTWAHWSCFGIGVASGASGALLAREDGTLWIEDDIYTDAATSYTHRIRTSWLHGGNVGDFQRVRRIGGLGRFSSLDTPTHTLRLEIFYDEREFWEERIEWEMPDSTVNSDTWGAGDWGDGVWGDTSATVSNLEDLTWEWERRPSRQKCSVFSIALEDVNTDGPGFTLSAFTLELASKSGLNRTAERSGTGTYRS